jgi:hypothetical protein
MEFVDYINLPPYGVANFAEQPIIEKQHKKNFHTNSLCPSPENSSTLRFDEKMKSDHSLDSVVQSVINSFIERSKVGIKKYGTNLDRTDLSFLDWVQHAQEEHMDAILYLEKMKQMYNFPTKTP